MQTQVLSVGKTKNSVQK